jgi:hypothetical protein
MTAIGVARLTKATVTGTTLARSGRGRSRGAGLGAGLILRMVGRMGVTAS